MKHELVKCVTMISGISGHLWPVVVPKDHLSFSEWPSPRVHIGSHEKERQNLCGRKTRYMQSLIASQSYVLAPIHIKLSFTKSEILSFTPCIDYSGGNCFKLGFVSFVSFFFFLMGVGVEETNGPWCSFSKAGSHMTLLLAFLTQSDCTVGYFPLAVTLILIPGLASGRRQCREE